MQNYHNAKSRGRITHITRGADMRAAIHADKVMHMRPVAIIDAAKFPSKTFALVMEGLMTDYLQSLNFDTDWDKSILHT